MPKFSERSARRLATCHPDLQAVMNKAIETVDFSILCGHRSEAEQNAAVANGFSKVIFPYSRHNTLPSRAVDIAPYPVDWRDLEGFKKLAKHIQKVARSLGVKLRHGADWNMNGEFSDEKFLDWPHWELVD